MEQIRTLDRLGLLRLWDWLLEGKPVDGWAEGKAFEYLILRAFEVETAHVVWPYFVSRSEQIDGAVFVDGMSCLVESKQQAHRLGFGPIARFKARLDRRPSAAIGLLFSSSGFTEPAVEEATRHPTRNVLLWKGADITHALMNGMRAGLQLKWRKAVEQATPDYQLGSEEDA
ncbi:restriction endonuclease [Hyalangium rubrum]|uniref:Restriction endonuclease n=1 Tax=Hyalangium rubrum TaxID=3103134 RepID=A0ABU5HFZ6_9BACT|nr:restriction endonuclease [Hyalangium sp. s54d21]MDY7232074.1 restriction endonuclease [Hyalangium sp. s54d21]